MWSFAGCGSGRDDAESSRQPGHAKASRITIGAKTAGAALPIPVLRASCNGLHLGRNRTCLVCSVSCGRAPASALPILAEQTGKPVLRGIRILMSTRAQKHLVGVFRLYQPSSCEPAYFVDRKQALRLVEERVATPINRGRAIRLMFQRPENIRDESCRIGPATIFAYARGLERAVAAVEGWAPSSPQSRRDAEESL